MSQKVSAIIVAAGRGTRVGGDLPKQYWKLGQRTVLRQTLDAFVAHTDINTVQPVIGGQDLELYREATDGLDIRSPVTGGATRQASVRAGLEAMADDAPDIVLVHDAARPFVKPELITRAIEAADKSGASIPALAVLDTVKTVEGNQITGTIDRSTLRTVQTPQAFRFADLLAAHRRAAEAGRDDFTDDAALAEWAGMTVTVFQGDTTNMKLTTAEDFARASAEQLAALSDIRTGSGIDVHTFGPGDHVIMGGIKIPHSHGLTGHSDADVVLHALVDAILGALADGDIGMHFPPSDPQWRGAASDQFLAYAVKRVHARGGLIAHLDVTVVCELPKVGPHREAIRKRVAEIAGLTEDRVAVKATTSEKMGFTGRGEGIAAFATATVRLPWT